VTTHGGAVRSARRLLRRLLAVACVVVGLLGAGAGSAHAAAPGRSAVAAVVATVPAGFGAPAARALPAAPEPPATPTAPATPPAPSTGGSVSVSIDGVDGKPSSSIVVLLGITVLSIAPSALLMMTSFTKIFVVLSFTRNALGLQGVPPNQVLAGIALFLSLFVMAPVLSQVNHDAVQPYLDGHATFTQAVDAGEAPLRDFMAAHTREQEIALMTRAADRPNPTDVASVPFTTLVPAFMLSELRSAFIMGFVIFVPFLVIDLVVSSSLMAMGMMMLPPVMVSLPFKILLFVLVDGWGLVITSLIGSYKGG
jgi:flagellar biosynthetic protein FliP